MPKPSRSTLIAASVGALLILAAIVVVIVIRTAGSGPSEAAEDWADARLSGDKDRQAELQCKGFDEDPFMMATTFDLFEPKDVEASDEVFLGDDSWEVTLSWSTPEGDQDVTVEVSKENGEYVVC